MLWDLDKYNGKYFELDFRFLVFIYEIIRFKCEIIIYKNVIRVLW